MRSAHLVLAAAVAALLTAGAVQPPAEAAATTTVRGTVTAAGRAIAGVEVGAWSPTGGVLVRARTRDDGAFALPVPAGVAVDVWAGTAPRSSRAVFTAGARRLVRGVIGRAAPAGAPRVLPERVRAALPQRLGGGRALRFRLQEAGRFAAPVADGGTGRVAIQRGPSDYRQWSRAVDGTAVSPWLVPGRYRVYWDPRPGRLAARTRVDVPAGGTATATAPVLAASATTSIRVTSAGAPVPAGVPVVAVGPHGTFSPASPTDDRGVAVQTGLAPGTTTYVVGRFFDDPDEGLPTGIATSDDVLPARVTVTVPPGGTSVQAAVDLRPASRITGTVAASTEHDLVAVAEDAAGAVVRTAGVGDGGRFTLGGLPAGTYAVLAGDAATHRYARTTATVGAGATVALPAALTPGTPTPVVGGVVPDGRRGHVRLRSSTSTGSYLVTADLGAAGRWSARVLPGRWAPSVVVPGRETVVRSPVVVRGSRRIGIAAGPRLGAVRARVVSGGVPVAVDLQALGPWNAEADGGPTSSASVEHRSPIGRATGTGLLPGHYDWLRALSPLPAVDGPWWFAPPDGGFAVRAGRTTDLGTVALSIRE